MILENYFFIGNNYFIILVKELGVIVCSSSFRVFKANLATDTYLTSYH